MEVAEDEPCIELSMLQSMLVRREVFIVSFANLDPPAEMPIPPAFDFSVVKFLPG